MDAVVKGHATRFEAKFLRNRALLGVPDVNEIEADAFVVTDQRNPFSFRKRGSDDSLISASAPCQRAAAKVSVWLLSPRGTELGPAGDVNPGEAYLRRFSCSIHGTHGTGIRLAPGASDS